MKSSGMLCPGDEGEKRWEQAWRAIKKVTLPVSITVNNLEFDYSLKVCISYGQIFLIVYVAKLYCLTLLKGQWKSSV